MIDAKQTALGGGGGGDITYQETKPFSLPFPVSLDKAFLRSYKVDVKWTRMCVNLPEGHLYRLIDVTDFGKSHVICIGRHNVTSYRSSIISPVQTRRFFRTLTNASFTVQRHSKGKFAVGVGVGVGWGMGWAEEQR